MLICMLVATNYSLYNIYNKIPKICPSVCDPFKNRANRLLEIAYEIYKKDGIESLIKNIEEIKESK